MVSDRTFRLMKDIIGIETVGEKRTAVVVPAGSIIDVVRRPTVNDNRLLDVNWEGRSLAVFYQDFDTRTERWDSQSEFETVL